MAEWLAQLALATCSAAASTAVADRGPATQLATDIDEERNEDLGYKVNEPEGPRLLERTSTMEAGYAHRGDGQGTVVDMQMVLPGIGYVHRFVTLTSWLSHRPRLLRAILEAAGDPDRDFLRRAEEGLPLGILEGLPRTPHVFEEQTSWRLDNAPWEPALAWVPNYVSVGEHKDFVKAKFEEDVAEGLMDRYWEPLKFRFKPLVARYPSLAVIVEDEEKDKKRIIHDATHAVRVNRRIKCRDKIRVPGAREKKQILRELIRCDEIAFSVVGAISKARRRYKHQECEHGYMGCQIDVEETIPGDPDSQIVYVNKVGTFGLSPASYWWTRIAGMAACGIRATHHLLGPGYPIHRGEERNSFELPPPLGPGISF
eukprot:s1629_g27.t2